MARGGDGKDPILAVLEQIRGELKVLVQHAKTTNVRLEHLDKGQCRLEKEVKGLKTEVRGLKAEQKKTNARLDNIVKFAGEQYRQHDAAIQDLRARVNHLEDRL